MAFCSFQGASGALVLLAASLAACGGMALDATDAGPDGAADREGGAYSAGDAPTDRDGWDASLPDASVVTPEASTTWEAGQTWEAGGTCSLPVGTPAQGCPLVLAPECPWSNMGQMFSGCEYPLASGLLDLANDPVYLAYVDVVVGGPFDGKGRLLRVENEAACGTTGNGWYYDDNVQPTTIRVCQNACDCALAAGDSFGVLAGCWANAAPGVVDAEIPCPRCPSVRPKQCPSAALAWGFGIVKCEFPIDPSIWSGDPSVTNLKYVQHGAVAGVDEPWDGYLTYVPSLAYCDNVEEGWTLDMSTDPPTVQVCPTACSCAKVSGAMLMVEHGCPRYEGGGL